MEDRNVQFPQRYQLKKVEGTEDIFDLIPAPGEIIAEGTLINKATLWKDATAALFGLGVDSVPDDGFAYLGKYAQHWWKRRTVTRTVDVDLGELDTGQGAWIEGPNMDDTPYPIPYSEELEVVGTSDVGLKNPKTLMLKFSTWETDVLTLREKYFYSTRGQKQLQYGASNLIPDGWSSSGGILTLNLRNFYSPKASVIRTDGPWEYVQSSDRSAYPDSGEQDGYEYEYLGIPFDNAVGAPGIEIGSYMGTGTYGQSSPNSLTFGFVPRLVFISGVNDDSYAQFYCGSLSSSVSLYGYLCTFNGTFGVDVSYQAKLEEKILTWYCTSVSSGEKRQLNSLNTKYYYIAIG